jgi:hypothetical protein
MQSVQAEVLAVLVLEGLPPVPAARALSLWKNTIIEV